MLMEYTQVNKKHKELHLINKIIQTILLFVVIMNNKTNLK